MNPMKRWPLLLMAAFSILAVTPAVAYQITWTKDDCAAYSYHGLHERYVYGGTMGWIDNDIWDSSTIEGVDCSSYVSRCLAIPDYVPEGEKSASYPYNTYELYMGVEHMIQINNAQDLQPWDAWVWRESFGGPSTGHTGLVKEINGSYMITREAISATSGIIESNRSIQQMIDWNCRFYRRENWTTPTSIPTVETEAATNLTDVSALLKGTLIDNGCSAVDQLGFAWGKTLSCSEGWLNGTISNDNLFYTTLDGLEPDTQYYFKAMAYNSLGWSSGKIMSFRTESKPTAPRIIIDNSATGTTYAGSWQVSEAEDPYGIDSLYARDGATYTWYFNSQPAGLYEVSMWWTELSTRTSSAPIKINHADGTTTRYVNQQTNGGQWNSLGQYHFDSSGSITLTAPGTYPISYCADAVKFEYIQVNQPPQAVIDSISPTSLVLNQQVTMVGHGTDDGSISAYQWISSIDGLLGTSPIVKKSNLSLGTHVISFRVQDDLGIWSDLVEEIVTVTEPVASEIIIDNGQNGTSSTGTWMNSSAEYPYGTNSLWSRDGATYTWASTSLSPGLYEVSMWWTQYDSRDTNIRVRVNHAGGYDEVYVNQKADGGQWNSLGQFYFGTAGSVILYTTQSFPVSYCADAIKFTMISPVDLRANFSASPTSGTSPLTVHFTDLSICSGTIDSWQWDFDNDGIIDSTQQNPSFQYTQSGTYSVHMVVSVDGIESELVQTDYIQVGEPVEEEIIIDNGDSRTTSWGTWAISGGADPYGTNSIWARETASYRWNFTPQLGGRYAVFLWWTDYPSRGTAIPINIRYGSGTTSRTVNQQTSGGQWNWIGTYLMGAGQDYYVQVSTIGDGTTASADAVRIVRISD